MYNNNHSNKIFLLRANYTNQTPDMQNKPVKHKITHWITNQHITPLKQKITLRIVKTNWLNVVL